MVDVQRLCGVAFRLPEQVIDVEQVELHLRSESFDRLAIFDDMADARWLMSFHGGPAGVRGITRSRATGGRFGTGGMRGRSPSSTSMRHDGRPRCATTLRRGPRLRHHSRRWAARNGGFGTTPGKKTVAKPFSQPSSAQVTGSKDLARACPSLSWAQMAVRSGWWRTSWSRDCGSEVSGVSPNHH